jgi:Zn-dependent protease
MRVLGFPVHVRRGFLVFMVLIVVLYGNEYGVWLAGSIAAFTLIHELGHAVAARSSGATAEISLDFFAGYASYTSPQPLSRRVEAMIALAGPLTHIAAGFLVLAVMGVNPLDAVGTGPTDAARAVWWAGPVIGAFNLIPVLPLDGGNVVTSALDGVLPGRARSVMAYVSVALTAAAAVVFALGAQLRWFVPFLGLLLLMQLQLLFDERERHAVSPFDKAMAALRAGNESKARRIATNGLRRPSSSPLVPTALDGPGVRELLAVLPRPLPFGDPWNEYLLTNLLVGSGEYREAATYGADSYARQPQPMLAATIARAAGALGDADTAVAWLRAAANSEGPAANLVAVIDRAPELAAVRARPDVIALRASLQPTR